MICETLRLPFRRDVVDRMLKGMVGTKSSPTLENLGQIADGLGLNAVLMRLPQAHLGRLSLPSVLELPDQQGLVLVTGSSNGRLRIIDPCEGERWIGLQDLDQDQQYCRAVTFSRRPTTATKRFDISFFFPFLQRYRRSLVLVFVASLFIQIFSLAQPLIIQQIIDKVIGQQNFNTLYFLGVLLIGCRLYLMYLAVRTFLFTDTTNRIDIATSGNILTRLNCLLVISIVVLLVRFLLDLLSLVALEDFDRHGLNPRPRCDFWDNLSVRFDFLQWFVDCSVAVGSPSVFGIGFYCRAHHQAPVTYSS